MRKEYYSIDEVKTDHPDSIDLIEVDMERNQIKESDFIKALQYDTEPGKTNNENLILFFKVEDQNNVCYVEVGNISDPDDSYIEEFYEMNRVDAELMFNAM